MRQILLEDAPIGRELLDHCRGDRRRFGVLHHDFEPRFPNPVGNLGEFGRLAGRGDVESLAER